MTMKCRNANEMQTVQRLHSPNSDQRRDNRLDGTWFTQFFLPPTRLSTNEMSHPASTMEDTESRHVIIKCRSEKCIVC